MARNKSTGGKAQRRKFPKQADDDEQQVSDQLQPLLYPAVAPVVLREPKEPVPPPRPKVPTPNRLVKPKVRTATRYEGSFIEEVQREYRREQWREYTKIVLIASTLVLVGFLIGWFIYNNLLE